MSSVREMMWKQQNPSDDVLPSRRESDLTKKVATSSVRETMERKQALERDAATPKPDAWTQSIIDRMKNTPPPVYAGPTSDAYLRHLAAEAERQRQADPEFQRRKREEEHRAAREKAAQELQRKRDLLAWKDAQRAAATEGLTEQEKYEVINRAAAMNMLDDYDAIALLRDQKIYDRPEHAAQRELERIMIEDDCSYADAQRTVRAKGLKNIEDRVRVRLKAVRVKAMNPTTGYER